MEAKITIKFKNINGIPVDDKLLKDNTQLRISTKQTMKILCRQIERYFKDYKIYVNADFEMENGK